MATATKTITVTIARDEDPTNPREWDNLGTMVCWHPRYTLGDLQPKGDPQEWYDAHVPKGAIVLPLYLLDHSGLRIKIGSFHDPWDSGQVGWIYVTREDVLKEYDRKALSEKVRRRVEDQLRAEVTIYDAYLSGNVLRYAIEEDDYHVESCGGFFGDDAITQMRDEVDAMYHNVFDAAADEFRTKGA